MNNKFLLLLLLGAFTLMGCGEKFDYRYKYTGTFDFTYLYESRWSGGSFVENRVTRRMITFDGEGEQIQLGILDHIFTLFVDKDGLLYAVDANGYQGQQVGAYNAAVDSISFPGGKLSWGYSNPMYYLISATRVD